VSVWFLIFQGDEKGFAEAGANLVCNNPERLKDKMDALYFWKPQKELVRVRGRKVISSLGDPLPHQETLSKKVFLTFQFKLLFFCKAFSSGCTELKIEAPLDSKC
jgi:hypothetical protein